MVTVTDASPLSDGGVWATHLAITLFYEAFYLHGTLREQEKHMAEIWRKYYYLQKMQSSFFIFFITSPWP